MLFDDTYKTIAKPSSGVFKDRGSKFIAFAQPVNSEVEAKKILADLKSEYHDACHHCYAYRIGFDKSLYRSSDDGEPSGTAGKPIYNQLLSYDLTNVIIVVVRYFGGTLLGVPGLINAYKSSTKDALENADIITRTVNERFVTNYEYPAMNDVMKILKDTGSDIQSTDFSEHCKVIFSIRKSLSENVVSRLKQIASVKVTFLSYE
jgi:uncharacterized YigZ family protein